MTFTVDIEIARTVGSTPSQNPLYVFAHFMFVPHIVYKNKYSVSKNENKKDYYTKLSFFGKQDALPVVYTGRVCFERAVSLLCRVHFVFTSGEMMKTAELSALERARLHSVARVLTKT